MYGPGFDGAPFGHLIFTIIGGLVWLIALAITIAVLFLFIRFLLVATKAAQVYVARNTPVEPTAAPSTPATTAAPPATKPRTPKAPPAN
jgi:hypothetical protein